MRWIIAVTALCLMPLAACDRAQSAPLVPALEKLAARNNAEAIYHLGMMWHTGSGVKKDPAKALDAFRRAAALGDPLGAYKLGCYYDGQGEGLVERDLDLALKYKLVAAEAGYALAQQDVGGLYARRGELRTAEAWLARAAAQGWRDALMANAAIGNGGPGLPRDQARIVAWFRLYLNRGDVRPGQREWLTTQEAKLTPEERDRADSIVKGYRPAPTALTMKALSGQRAAEALVAGR